MTNLAEVLSDQGKYEQADKDTSTRYVDKKELSARRCQALC
jgi:hypothetical protein